MISADAHRGRHKPLADQGVIFGFRWPHQVGPDPGPLADKIAKLCRFADRVVTRVGNRQSLFRTDSGVSSAERGSAPGVPLQASSGVSIRNVGSLW